MLFRPSCAGRGFMNHKPHCETTIERIYREVTGRKIAAIHQAHPVTQAQAKAYLIKRNVRRVQDFSTSSLLH
jgi:hypothetical protein